MIIERPISFPKDFVRALRGCETLLDLGSARGGKLDKLCQALGATGVGYEINPEVVKLARQTPRIIIRVGDAVEAIVAQPERSVDGVVMIDFLEHLDKPSVLRVMEYSRRVARKAVIGTMPLECVPRTVPGPYMEHKTTWSLRGVAHLWGPAAVVLHDPTFHLRLSSHKGPEYVEKLRREHYHGGPYPEWMLAVLRFDIDARKIFS